MCGGDLTIDDSSSICTCDYCGTQQTVPKANDEKKIKLFDRANRLRMACEFDKAYSVYETIVDEFDSEAEAYWGLVLCKYGIEYVDDPKTGKKIPVSDWLSMMGRTKHLLKEEYVSVVERMQKEIDARFEELKKSIK